MFFWMLLFGALTVVSAAGVVCSRKSLNSALCLVATLFCVAVHFALLGADFIAALQILIYAGAIMVLVIFVIMLLGLRDAEAEVPGFSPPRYLAAIFSGAFLGVIVFVFKNNVGVHSPAPGAVVTALTGEAREVGLALLTDHIFAFQISALLLLAAVMGAVILAYEPRRGLQTGRGLRAVQSNDRARNGEASGGDVGEEPRGGAA